MPSQQDFVFGLTKTVEFNADNLTCRPFVLELTCTKQEVSKDIKEN